MAFDVSGLTTYVEEQKGELMAANVLGAKMLSHVQVIPGVKGETKLPLVANTIFLQSDACGFNASGTSTFSQRSIVPGKVRLNMEWCPKDLETKYFAAKMKAGANGEEVDPSDVFKIILDDIASQISYINDVAIWQGDTSTGTGNNQYWNGFIDTIGGAGIDANATSGIYDGTAVTSVTDASQAQEVAYRMYSALGQNGLTDNGDAVCFVGYDSYTAMVNSLVQGASTFGPINSFGGSPEADANMEGFVFPGTGLKFIPVAGLTGTDKVYGGRKSNFFVGVDAEDDPMGENLKLWYSEDNGTIRMRVAYKMGTQVAYPGEVAHIII